MSTLARRGFTVIELIVVIAIIAVLAVIVLSNVTSYISKGKNSAVRGDFATLANNATVYFDANIQYTGFCTSSYVTTASAAVDKALGLSAGTTAGNCSETSSTWCT